jgi:hypothetical protein
MNTTTRRLAGLSLASAAATVALAAPATAMPKAPSDVSQHHGPGLVLPSGHNATSDNLTVAGSGTDWAQIGYGAAGGVALAAAGVAGIILVRRQHHLPHHV